MKLDLNSKYFFNDMMNYDDVRFYKIYNLI